MNPNDASDAIQASIAGSALRQALAHHQAGNLLQASQLYEAVLQIAPDSPDALHLLGVTAHQNGNHGEAVRLIARAIQVDPNQPAFHSNLGVALQAEGSVDAAILAYRRALEMDPGHVDALYNLGNALSERDDLNEALDYYRRALEASPKHAQALYNLGNALLKLGKSTEAAEAYRGVLEISPRDGEACKNLGVALMNLGKVAEAVAAFRRALSLNPQDAEALCDIGLVLREQGRSVEAVTAYRGALAIKPTCLTAKWGELLTLPVIHDSAEGITRRRTRWAEGVRELLDTVDLNSSAGVQEAVKALTSFTNFYLHYQGHNDLELQIPYGSLQHRIATAAYPQHANAPARRHRSNGERIRVGFVSAFFYDHLIAKTHGRWITGLDKQSFETHVFHVGTHCDGVTQELRDGSDYFQNGLVDNTRLVESIAAKRLDAIIYTDVGLEPKLQLLAALRLAPVQCAGWGHPVTSGLPSLDYFLGSDAMEPEDGAAHYSEKLIRLPNLASSYPFPKVEQAKRPASVEGAKSGQVTYVNLQSLFKLLPQYDDIYPQIALSVPDCRFWFVDGRYDDLTRQFKERLALAFLRHGLKMDRYCTFHPRMSQLEFLGLARSADVILDSIGWSGCVTTLEAMPFAKPIVTLPGPMMRGRQTSGILKLMDATETVARDVDDYIGIAARLGLDSEFRNRISERLAERSHVLYDDDRPIRALEEFLRSVA